MLLDMAAYSPVADEKFIHIRTASTLQQVLAFADIIACNWHPPDPNIVRYYEQAAKQLLLTANHVTLLLYYYREKPVATLELFPTDAHTMGLYNLSTLAAYRGNGIGSTLMRYALCKARELGYHRVVLQASQDGMRIYRRLGFRVAGRR